MKLITTNAELRKNLSRLSRKYSKIAFAVAWASAGTEVFEIIKSNQNKITKAIIGTHFYQTHPDVLETFIDSENVRFMLQPKGVFHPKAYLFEDENSWEMLIGSANLTAGAMNINSEIMVLISDEDEADSTMKSDLIDLIGAYWNQARSISAAEAESYRALWKKQQPALNKLSGQYGQTTEGKAPSDSSVMSMTWHQYLAEVKHDAYHGFKKRCDLLQFVQNAFEETKHFQNMELGMRKTIAGLPTEFNEHWAWFGSMKGAGYYHQAINNNNDHISLALDEIPLNGPVLRKHYESYINEFIKAFPNGRDGVGIASRLLALKRPDYFVCLDSKNKDELCADFDIRKSGIDYDRYWDEIIERVIDSAWWSEPRPTDKLSAQVWDFRVAMLDAIFYNE